MTIRNVFMTRRWSRTKVIGADFKVGRFALAGWGYVFIRTTDGKAHRVTALRRPPRASAETLRSINSALATP